MEKISKSVVDELSDADIQMIINEAVRLSDEIKMPDGGINYNKVFGWYEQQMKYYMEDSSEKRPAVGCKKGCAFCCHLRVETLPGEMDFIMSHMSEYDRTDLYSRARERKEAVLSKPEEFPHVSKPCVFLQKDNTCGIYDIRPLNCRGMIVEDAKRCEEIFNTGIDGGVPYHGLPKLLLSSIGLAIQFVINDTKDVHTVFSQPDGPKGMDELMEDGILNYLTEKS